MTHQTLGSLVRLGAAAQLVVTAAIILLLASSTEAQRPNEETQTTPRPPLLLESDEALHEADAAIQRAQNLTLESAYEAICRSSDPDYHRAFGASVSYAGFADPTALPMVLSDRRAARVYELLPESPPSVAAERAKWQFQTCLARHCGDFEGYLEDWKGIAPDVPGNCHAVNVAALMCASFCELQTFRELMESWELETDPLRQEGLALAERDHPAIKSWASDRTSPDPLYLVNLHLIALSRSGNVSTEVRQKMREMGVGQFKQMRFAGSKSQASQFEFVSVHGLVREDQDAVVQAYNVVDRWPSIKMDLEDQMKVVRYLSSLAVGDAD